MFVNCRRISGAASNLLRYLFLVAIYREKAASHMYVVAKGIRYFTAHFANSGYSCSRFIQKGRRESLLYLVFKVRSVEMSISCSFSVTDRFCFITLSASMSGLRSHVRGSDCFGKYSRKLSFNCCSCRIMQSLVLSASSKEFSFKNAWQFGKHSVWFSLRSQSRTQY